MKSINSTFSVLMILSFLMLFGCNTDTGINNEALIDFETGAFAVFDFDDAVNAVEDATIENSMSINPDLMNGSFLETTVLLGPEAPEGPSVEAVAMGWERGLVSILVQFSGTLT